MKNNLRLLIVIILCLPGVLSAQRRAELKIPDPIILCTPEKVDLRDASCIFINADGIPTAILGGRMMFNIHDKFLKSDPYYVILPEGRNIETMLTTLAGNVISKEGRMIRQYTDSMTVDLLEMPDENFEIYPSICRDAFYVLIRKEEAPMQVWLVSPSELTTYNMVSTWYPKGLTGLTGDATGFFRLQRP